MKHQHNTITITTLIYLCLFLLMGGIGNFAFAQTTPPPSTPKISFATVKDSGTSPKTASCLIAWPTGKGAEENIFCVYDNQLRDNDEIGKMFKSDGTLPPIAKPPIAKDSSKNVETWLKKNSFDPTAAKSISSYFKDLNGDPSSSDIQKYLRNTNTPSEKLELLKEGCSHYNTLAPLITPEAFALFVHDFIHHHLQKSEDQALINSFCSNPATALVLLDKTIQPLLQNPDVVKLLNDEGARTFLESIKDKGDLLALLNPDVKKNPNLTPILEVLKSPDVLKLLTTEVVTLLKNPGVVEALVDEKFHEKIDVVIQKHSEVQKLLSETKQLLLETKQQLGTATAQGNPSLEWFNDSIKILPDTSTMNLDSLKEKTEKLSELQWQTVLAIVICSLIVAILLVFFWLYERDQWKDVLVDNDSIIRREISNINDMPQIKNVFERLMAIDKKISAIPNTGSSGDVSGMDKAISDIQAAVKDAVAYAFTDYQEQQSRPPVVEQTSVQQVLEKVDALKTTLTNYPTGQELITSLNNLYQQGQEISKRLPLDSSLWIQLKDVVKSIPQMSSLIGDLKTILTQDLSMTLTKLTESLSSAKNELKGELENSQKQQHTQMTQSLESLDGKVADIDKLLKSKELWEKAVLNPVKGVIETSLDFRSKYEAEQSQRQILETDRTTLLTVLEKRFGYTPPDRANLSSWATTLTEQPGTWRWSQSPLRQQLVICQGLLQQLQQREIAKDSQEILVLLFDQDQRFFTGWETLTSQSFEGDSKMWNYLRTLDGGKWLNSLFRANDLLHAYFADKPQFSELSKHLATTAGLLKVALAEVGIGLRESPKLLENIPTDIPEKSKNYTPLPLLKKLVKSKVVEKSETAPRLVVDIEAYGFATPDNPQPEIRVVVFSPAEWQ
jgi:hypothetical protein